MKTFPRKTLLVVLLFVTLMTLAGSPVLDAQTIFDPDDYDRDGLPDPLELALAQYFFPILNLHCGTFEGLELGDRRQLYGHDVPGYSNASTGRIPFTAHLYSAGNGVDCALRQCVEIRYGIAWNWDLGDDFWRGPHPGDSEVYAILVAHRDTDGNDWGVSWDVAKNDVTQWRLMKEFMSGHWGTPAESSSFRGHGNYGTSWYQYVWAAEGKHALYESQAACNRGGWFGADDCSDNRCYIDIWNKVQNAGEHDKPLNPTIPYPASRADMSPSGTYDVWSGNDFGESTSYLEGFHTKTLKWCPKLQACHWSCGTHEPSLCPSGSRYMGYCEQGCGFEDQRYNGTLCENEDCYSSHLYVP